MVLKKESPRTAGVVNHFVDALPELGISLFLRHELGTDARVPGTPALAAVVRAIDSSSRHCNEHPPRVLRIEDNRVQTEASAAGLPLGLMLMIQQSLVRLPAFATIARLEERGRFDTAIENLGLTRSAGRNLPDLREGAA
jgi:hypothetical protein